MSKTGHNKYYVITITVYTSTFLETKKINRREINERLNANNHFNLSISLTAAKFVERWGPTQIDKTLPVEPLRDYFEDATERAVL